MLRKVDGSEDGWLIQELGVRQTPYHDAENCAQEHVDGGPTL
jgi:hypothetical protein